MANVIDKVAGLVVGPQGPQGPQGPKGDTGQTGPQGATGATGATPNLTMGTVTTLEPDSPATATITGTAENPVLNLGLPKGRTGEVSQAEFDEVAEDVSQLKSEFADNIQNIISDNYSVKTAYATSEGYKLLDSGICTADQGYKLYKYSCRAGIPMFVWSLNSDVKMQFQNSQSVPSSGTNQYIVSIVEDGYSGNLDVPVGAVYLIMSVKISDTVSGVYFSSKELKYDNILCQVQNHAQYGKYYLDPQLESGGIDESTGNGANTNNPLRLRSGVLMYPLTSDIMVELPSGMQWFVIEYDENYAIASHATGWLSQSNYSLTYPFFKIVIRKSDNSAIAVSDASDFKIYSVASGDNVHAYAVNPVFYTERFIAHRCLVTAPENTIPAIKEAIASGYKMVEFDVRFTSDNVPVLIHDDTINRTARNADGTELSSTVYVASSTYAELSEYDYGVWKGQAYAETAIPTLEETLVVLKKHNVCCDLDLTTLGSAVTTAQMTIIVDMLTEAGMLGYAMITNSVVGISTLLSVSDDVIVCVSNVSTSSTVDTAYALIKRTKMPTVSMQYPYRTQAEYNYAHGLGLMIKAFTFGDNLSINSNLNFMPDFQIIDTLKRNEIVLT